MYMQAWEDKMEESIYLFSQTYIFSYMVWKERSRYRGDKMWVKVNFRLCKKDCKLKLERCHTKQRVFRCLWKKFCYSRSQIALPDQRILFAKEQFWWSIYLFTYIYFLIREVVIPRKYQLVNIHSEKVKNIKYQSIVTFCFKTIIHHIFWGLVKGEYSTITLAVI